MAAGNDEWGIMTQSPGTFRSDSRERPRNPVVINGTLRGRCRLSSGSAQAPVGLIEVAGHL